MQCGHTIHITWPEVSGKLYFVEVGWVSEKLWFFNRGGADFFGFRVLGFLSLFSLLLISVIFKIWKMIRIAPTSASIEVILLSAMMDTRRANRKRTNSKNLSAAQKLLPYLFT